MLLLGLDRASPKPAHGANVRTPDLGEAMHLYFRDVLSLREGFSGSARDLPACLSPRESLEQWEYTLPLDPSHLQGFNEKKMEYLLWGKLWKA